MRPADKSGNARSASRLAFPEDEGLYDEDLDPPPAFSVDPAAWDRGAGAAPQTEAMPEAEPEREAEAATVPPQILDEEAAAAAAIARALSEAEADVSQASSAEALRAPKVALAPDIRDILREEAAIEADARRQEEQRAATRRADAEVQIQTQPDLGVDAVPAPPTSAVQRRLAMLKGERPTTAVPEPQSRAPARRDLLPDVEEINSTLHPGDDSHDADAAVDALPDLTRSSGFRNGFVWACVLLLLATGIYMAADTLATLMPAAKSYLADYVAFVDGLRIWLNDSMDNVTRALSQDRS